MLEQSVIDKIFAELKAEHEELATATQNGGAENYAAYRGMVGEMAGLRAATDIIKEVLRKSMETDTEETDEPARS